MLAHVELYQWSSGPYSQDFTASKWLGWKCSFNMNSSFGTQNLRMKPNSRTWASCSHEKGGLVLWMLGWAFSLGEARGCWYCWLFSWLCEYRLILLGLVPNDVNWVLLGLAPSHLDLGGLTRLWLVILVGNNANIPVEITSSFIAWHEPGMALDFRLNCACTTKVPHTTSEVAYLSASMAFSKIWGKEFPYLRVHGTSYICRVCKPANHSASISPDNKRTKTVPVPKHWQSQILHQYSVGRGVQFLIYLYINM